MKLATHQAEIDTLKHVTAQQQTTTEQVQKKLSDLEKNFSHLSSQQTRGESSQASTAGTDT
eukprot:4465228-Prorocentrum_lima.AAC.1